MSATPHIDGLAAEQAVPGPAPARQWPAPPDPAAYHGLAGQFVALVAPHTEAHEMALLGPLLTSVGNLIGRGPHTVAEADRHYANLFTVLVGRSSKGRKGTSWGHVRRAMEAADSDWASKRILGGMSSGEGLIWNVRDRIERKNEDGDLVVADEGEDDKRLLCMESELAAVLRVLERDGNRLSATIRQAWDTGDLRTMVSGRREPPAKATGAQISIVGHITADELRRYLTATESGNGFANRFMWLCVARSKVLPEGGAIHTVNFETFDHELRRVIDHARRLGHKAIQRDAGARDLWASVYEKLSEGHAGLLGAVTSRAEAQVLRLSLLYALLDGATLIGEIHLQAALAVWDYAERSARYIFGDSLGDPLADEILVALRASADGMTRTDLRDHFARNRQKADLDRALAMLAEHGLAVCSAEQTGGKPAQRWRVLRPTTKTTKGGAEGASVVSVVNVVTTTESPEANPATVDPYYADDPGWDAADEPGGAP